jgi:thioredoxin reductase
MDHYDVLVVGAGYAGLSTALTLGRARRSVLVTGSRPPRNARSAASHGFLTADGTAPGDLHTAARDDLAAYPAVRFLAADVDDVAQAGEGFRAVAGPATVAATRIVLATGVEDRPPAIDGLAELWGRGVHTCPYCDGWEHRDQVVAVIGDPGRVPLLARTLTGWTDHVIAFATVTAIGCGVTADDRRVVRVRGKDGAAAGIDLDDGSALDVGAVFVAGRPAPRTHLARRLGYALDDTGFVAVDHEGRTTVPGVWAAGDVAHPEKHQVAVAVADGVLAGRSCNADLLGLTATPRRTNW